MRCRTASAMTARCGGDLRGPLLNVVWCTPPSGALCQGLWVLISPSDTGSNAFSREVSPCAVIRSRLEGYFIVNAGHFSLRNKLGVCKPTGGHYKQVQQILVKAEGRYSIKKTPSYGYRNPHYKPYMDLRPSQVYNRYPYTNKTMFSW